MQIRRKFVHFGCPVNYSNILQNIVAFLFCVILLSITVWQKCRAPTSYRAMHYSAKHSLAIACRPSVCPSTTISPISVAAFLRLEFTDEKILHFVRFDCYKCKQLISLCRSLSLLHPRYRYYLLGKALHFKTKVSASSPSPCSIMWLLLVTVFSSCMAGPLLNNCDKNYELTALLWVVDVIIMYWSCRVLNW